MSLLGHQARLMSGGQGDPYWDYVASLLHFDGDLTDARGATWTPQGSVGFAAGRFSDSIVTSTGHIETPAAAWNNLGFGQGDFTVEMFIKQTSPNNSAAIFGSLYTQRNDRIPLAIAFGKVGSTTLGNNLYFGLFRDPWVGADSAWSPATGVWHHIAASRAGNVYRLFADGVQIATFASDVVVATTRPLMLGNRWDVLSGGQPRFQGQIDEFRLTKGVARYTSNFTPPAAPFPNGP